MRAPDRDRLPVRSRAWAAIAIAIAVGGAIALGAEPAGAFWPFPVPMEAPPDTAKAAQVERRWSAFRTGAAAPAPVSVAAEADSALDRTQPPPSAGQLAAQAAAAARERATADSLAAISGTRAPDTTGTLVGDLAAMADSVALADSTALVSGAGIGAGTTPGATGTPGTPGATPGTAGGTTPGAGTPSAVNSAAMAALAARAAALKGWAPELTSTFTTSNDNMTGSADMRTAFSDGAGLTLSNMIGTETAINELRGDEQNTYRLSNALAVPLSRSGLSASLSTSNNRTILDAGARNNAVGRRDTDLRGGQAAIRYSRALAVTPGFDGMQNIVRGIGLNAFYGYDVSSSRTDLGLAGNPGASRSRRRGTGNTYGAGLSFDRLRLITVRARFGRLRHTNEDITQQFVTSDSVVQRDLDSDSEGDTTSVDISIPAIGPIRSVAFGFRTARGEDTSPEQSTGSSGQLAGSGFQFETTTFRSRTFNIAATVQPFRQLNTVVTATVSRDSTNYRIKRQQFSDTERIEYKLENRLTFWRNAALNVIYESKFADVDRDVFIDSMETQNPLTHKDEQRRLYAEVTKPFTESMTLVVSGEIKLDQGFYVHPVAGQGLSDLDQLRSELRAVLTGKLNASTTGSVTAYMRIYNQDFIDPRRSASSRDETEYVVRPNYNWTVNERISIQQGFGLESKVIEPIFNPQNRTLARKHYATTGFNYRPLTRLRVDGAYDYLLQDSGRYTAVDQSGKLFFSREQQSRKGQVSIGAHYTLIAGDKLVFTSQQTANRIRTRFGSSSSTLNEQQTLRLGFTSALQVGDIKLDARMFRLQNTNATLDRDVFWNGDAKLVWVF